MVRILLNKYSFISLIFLFLLNSCRNKRIIENNNYYKVYKIDSINNYYQVYIKGGSVDYKIVSKKEKNEISCNTLEIGKSYPNFVLQKLIDTEKYIPKNTEVVNALIFVPDCIKMDDSTEICRERGMDNIYISENLKGLCYKN